MQRDPNNPANIEPGLLPILKALTTLQFVILLLAFCNLSNSDPANAVFVTLMLLHTTVLLLYLRITRLQRWFGRLYLPLAIIGTTVAPMFLRTLTVLIRLDSGLVGDAAATDSGALILWLVEPLVAIATQYGWWSVVLFSVLTTITELTLAAGLADGGSIPVSVTIEQEVIRNFIFLAVGWIIARLIREQRVQRRKLHEANQQLKQFAVTSEQLAISRERNRMARDLHDTLAHTLSAVAIQLEAVDAIWETSPDRARATLAKIQQVTRDGLTETRGALQALRTSPIDDLGLVMSLQHTAEKAADRAGFRLHSETPATLPDMPHEVEVTTYRIAEEALNNVVRHAEARDVWLSLVGDADRLRLRVRDNGVGFDVDAPSPDGHYGIVGMRERATLCGGTLSVASEPDVGTVITLDVPLT